MYYLTRPTSLLLSLTIVFSTLPAHHAARAQDLIATEDIASGSSVFVFRESRKKPHARSGGARAVAGYSGRARAGRSNSQIAAVAQRRRAAALATVKRSTGRPAGRKEALSNTLTAKADAFLEEGKTDLAISNYRAALVQNQKNKRASDGLSNALTAKGIEAAGETNDPAAIVHFVEAVKWDTQNDAAYAKLGALYDASGDRAKAIDSYESALAINADYSMLYAPLGIDQIAAGEIAKAEEALRRSEAAGLDNIDVRYLRGLVLFHQNDNDGALAAFNKALELEGRFAEAQYYRGQVLDRLGNKEQAISAYKGAIAVAPDLSPALFDLGVAYYNAGDYENAAVAYQETVKKDPNNAQAHANLASAYRQLERYGDANAEYKLAAVQIKEPDLYSEWGYCLGKTNEWDKSVARLQTALEMSPAAVDNSNVGWAYYNAGNSLAAAKNDTAAKEQYALGKPYLQKAVEQDPRLDAAYVNLGSTHNALGEFQAAVQVLNIVLGMRRDWSIALNQLGVGYRGMKDLVNAVSTFKRVVDLDGQNTLGLYNLGEAYYASGNKKEAKKINDRLRKIDPTLATRLDNVLAGRAIDAVKQSIPTVPRVPRRPF